MNWNIFWGIFILIFAIGLFITWYFVYIKKKKLYALCTQKIQGKVIKYSRILYNGITLPVVEYTVSGNTYTNIGPKFNGIVFKSFTLPFSSVDRKIVTNITDKNNLPKVLKINANSNSMISLNKSPLMDLFPIDSFVDVYYNPNNPKQSYIHRFVMPGFWINILLVLGIIFLILAIFIFVGPRIVM